MGKNKDNSKNDSNQAALGKKARRKFEEATAQFAIRTDLDPVAIKEAYKGREALLLARSGQIESKEVGAAFAVAGSGVSALGTAMTILFEAGSYGSDGPLNNIEYGAPFVLFFAAVAAWQLKRRRQVDAGVKKDVEKYAGNPQALLPPPATPALPPPAPGLT
jgi:hypothetical protein